MAWTEISLNLRAEQRARAEAALEDLGALSITLADAHLDTPDERAIFEPGVDETPLWPEIACTALFDADTDRPGLLQALTELVPGLDSGCVGFRDIADQDWTRAWMDRYEPMQFGLRLWIYPWNIEPPAEEDLVAVRLDPGLAFGSGTHPTTAMCLRWLDSAELCGKTVIDYGCGSGVLAIAALKLGAARAIGIDNDPQALTASRDNAQRNGCSEHLDLFLPDDFKKIRADVLVANILAGPLQELAPRFADCVAPGGDLALSGILRSQSEKLLAHYGNWFEALEVASDEGWCRINGRRKH